MENQEQAPTVHNYLFALTHGGGANPPELGVVSRLVARGHDVLVLADASMETGVVVTGAKFTRWSGEPLGEIQDWKKVGPRQKARMTVEHMFTARAADQLLDTLTALESEIPHQVVTSFNAFGAMLAAESRGVDFSVLLPNIYPMPAKGLPPLAMGLAPARGFWGATRDSMLNAMGGRLINNMALPQINALRTQQGLVPLTTVWDQVHHAKRELILTSRSFDFPAQLPDNARYAGPILDDPWWAANTPWDFAQHDLPLILVAMSSTFQNHGSCMQRIVDALGELPVRGLLTTGPAIDVAQIRVPPNVSVVEAAAHSQIMAHTDLVITHGGHGTVIKALAEGTPLLILPHGRDQAENASRVTRRGAGIAISRKSSAAKIAKVASRILETESYRLAAAELGKSVAADASTDHVLLAELGA
ncbi:glycosyl transferase [Arthrobacter sp. MYb227]|uniref:nucleotide disphospho-sugar-binding domain-containing protein n=1 Tax=Arthrobacter sp. MYb227 TaxID=1848601 RepID=UPI000CFD601C|nr:nucleotide disphospho-sugar-binding domain-containing protein [Arthrobacter sp. MYb227]PQZ88130.1 glycosyl transferase [Arthrobacter sp. MYb227]